ncbi:MAG: hypothetical protein COW76_18985 [Shewanella sp. CG18_big_fil_WC_8_21_14_2_50_42_11]|nr:MAG: hypothetical protein COW76_18985 [Shewanella sp. CG18_big_fil_WC_8_21_14_2_50_42_11]PIX71976.1 MAG: hypothetical protein COZ42_07955 [Shewanella sp. CG_4_10_14_3_um_filter_42_91]
MRDVERNIRIISIKLSSEMVNDLINVASKVINTGFMVNRLDDFLSVPATSMLRMTASALSRVSKETFTSKGKSLPRKYLDKQIRVKYTLLGAR